VTAAAAEKDEAAAGATEVVAVDKNNKGNKELDKNVEKHFDFWNDHSETFLTMAYLWERRQAIEQPDGYGRKTGDCGDSISIYLVVKDGRISRVNYELDGCLHTNACANALASLVEGKTMEQGWAIMPHDIIAFLETLPQDHHHCAELTVGAFYLALAAVGER
jgi:nitrogen fixation protein NifU and related proteins